MSGIKRAWHAFGLLGVNRWWWTFWAVFVGAQVVAGGDVPRWYTTPLLVLYAVLAGWHWRREIEKRHRRPPVGYVRIETLMREDDVRELLGEWGGRRG